MKAINVLLLGKAVQHITMWFLYDHMEVLSYRVH